MPLTAWPAMVDDDGTYTVGTRANKALFDSVRASIETAVCSGTNPTVTAANAIDEIVTARGSKASLDARLDVAHNDDGTHKTLTGYATTAQVGRHYPRNLLNDSLMNLWDTTTSLLGWTMSLGTLGIYSAATAGLSYGDHCVQLTNAGVEVYASRAVLLAADVARLSGLKGRKVSFGMNVVAGDPNQACIEVYDGVLTTIGGVTGNGTYHTGGGTEEWLYCTHTIDAAATELTVRVRNKVVGDVFFNAGVLILSDIPPTDWFSERIGLLYLTLQQRGVVTADTTLNELRFALGRAGVLQAVTINVGVAPGVSNAIWDVNKAGTTALAAAKATVPFGTTVGSGAPSTTHSAHVFSSTALVTVDCDNAGGTAAEEATITITFACPMADLDWGLVV